MKNIIPDWYEVSTKPLIAPYPRILEHGMKHGWFNDCLSKAQVNKKLAMFRNGICTKRTCIFFYGATAHRYYYSGGKWLLRDNGWLKANPFKTTITGRPRKQVTSRLSKVAPTKDVQAIPLTSNRKATMDVVEKAMSGNFAGKCLIIIMG